MPHPTSRGPWETAVPPADPPHDVPRPLLLHAVIQPNRGEDRSSRLILVLAGFVAVGLGLPFLLRGEPIVAVLLLIELTALALAVRAYRRWANERSEELNLFVDTLVITTRIGRRVSVDRLPTAWLTIEPARGGRRTPSGFILSAAPRRLRVGGWLGPAQSQDLRQALEDTLALARRGGLAASTAPTRTWSSRTALVAPVDPASWAGSSGRS